MTDEYKPTHKQINEYLRRNRLHAASVGVHYGIKSVTNRIEKNWTKKPLWLLNILNRELEKTERVHKEMALHRDEISLYEQR